MLSMTPSTWITSVLIAGGWLVGLPLAVHTHGGSLLGAFAFVYGITLGCLLFIGGLIALDEWWLRRRR